MSVDNKVQQEVERRVALTKQEYLDKLQGFYNEIEQLQRIINENTYTAVMTHTSPDEKYYLENITLNSELEKLRSENESLHSTIKSQQSAINQLKFQITDKLQIIEQLNKEIIQQKHQVSTTTTETIVSSSKNAPIITSDNTITSTKISSSSFKIVTPVANPIFTNFSKTNSTINVSPNSTKEISTALKKTETQIEIKASTIDRNKIQRQESKSTMKTSPKIVEVKTNIEMQRQDSKINSLGSEIIFSSFDSKGIVLTYKQLVAKNIIENIDMTRKEMYLSGEEFKEIFGFSKDVRTSNNKWNKYCLNSNSYFRNSYIY